MTRGEFTAFAGSRHPKNNHALEGAWFICLNWDLSDDSVSGSHNVFSVTGDTIIRSHG